MPDPDYRSISFWLDTLPAGLTPRAPLDGSADADVAIVGGGFTGMWTAYYLSRLRPELRIAVVEADVVGFGASGRNGGWCTGTISGIQGLLARPARRSEGLALQRAAFDAVDEVGRVCEAEGIDCHYAKGGALHVATTPAQREVGRHHVAALRGWGLDDESYRWLEPDECAERVRIDGSLGGLFTPHCAALNPARLVRGLGDLVESRGVRILEQTRVHSISPRSVTTERGELRAEVVVRATEGYTRTLRGERRRLVPIHSLMIATEPLPDALWKEIGLERRETFGDGRRIVIYGQRTGDGRIAFGARADYLFGSRIQDRFDRADPRFDLVHRTLLQLFPSLEGVEITHRWGGPLGVPRTWRPSVGLDRETGLAWAGGYVGQGVAAANLAGRTLAELIAEDETERGELAWVAAQPPAWEPEPLRWLAVSGLTRLGDSIDRAEIEGRSPRLRASIFGRFVRM